jgi:hypothetical protein
MYTEDWDGMFPGDGPTALQVINAAYANSTAIFKCPSSSNNNPLPCDYGMNNYCSDKAYPVDYKGTALGDPAMIDEFAYPSSTVMVYEDLRAQSLGAVLGSDAWDRGCLAVRHSGGDNILCCDSHAKWLPTGQIASDAKPVVFKGVVFDYKGTALGDPV